MNVTKGILFVAAEIVDYSPNSVKSKAIYQKATGSITIFAFDNGTTRTEKSVAFDTYIQIIEGSAEMEMNGVSQMLGERMSIIVPAHTPVTIKAVNRFKMLYIVIKSGYE